MASWTRNKDWMLKQEAAGKATAGHKAWLKKWRAAGSPSTEAGMSKPKPSKPVFGSSKPSAAQANAAAEAKKKADAAAAAKAAADRRKAAEAAAKRQQQEKIRAQAAAEAAKAKKAADAAAKKKAAAYAAAKAAAAAKPKPTTGKGVVGADGLTNEERYKKRQQEKADKAAAEKARIAELDKDRPEGVSRYLWEKVLKGDSNFNKALVSKNPEISDAIAGAGHEDWVKAIHEQAMDQSANHYMGNGASAADAWNTAQNSWYNKKYGSYGNETVANEGNNDLGFGGSTGAPANPEYVAPEPPPPIVETPPTGNPGGMLGGLVGVVNGTRPPTSTPVKDQTPPGGTITGPTYQEQLEAAQAAQKAAYEQQLAAQQAQYDQQVAAQQAAYEQRQADAEAARQAEIDRRNAEALAKKEANTASWASANASAAGIASSAPSYTKKYGEGATAGVGLLSGVNSVRGDPARTGIPAGVASEPPRTGGARPSGPVTGGVRGGPSAPTFKPPVIADDSGFAPSHQPGGFNPSHDVWDISHRPKQESTPWADAFLRSKKAAEAPGAVSGMMKKYME